MLQYIYLGIVLFLLVCILAKLFAQKSVFSQIDAALVLVPLVLRLLLIK